MSFCSPLQQKQNRTFRIKSRAVEIILTCSSLIFPLSGTAPSPPHPLHPYAPDLTGPGRGLWRLFANPLLLLLNPWGPHFLRRAWILPWLYVFQTCWKPIGLEWSLHALWFRLTWRRKFFSLSLFLLWRDWWPTSRPITGFFADKFRPLSRTYCLNNKCFSIKVPCRPGMELRGIKRRGRGPPDEIILDIVPFNLDPATNQRKPGTWSRRERP